VHLVRFAAANVDASLSPSPTIGHAALPGLQIVDVANFPRR
jgi:hypothetical protein